MRADRTAPLAHRTAPRKTPLAHGFAQGGGGGVSTYFSKPAWQDDLPGTQRLLPDLSLLADWDEGAIVVEPNGDGTSSYRAWRSERAGRRSARALAVGEPALDRRPVGREPGDGRARQADCCSNPVVAVAPGASSGLS